MKNTESTGLMRVKRLSYGLEELAEMIGVSRGFLRLEIKRGKLASTHLGRRVVVTSEEVKRYLNGDS